MLYTQTHLRHSPQNLNELIPFGVAVGDICFNEKLV